MFEWAIILHNHSSSQCGFPRSHSTEAVAAGLNFHRRVEFPHKRRTGVLIRSCAACGQTVASAYIVAVPLGPCRLHRHSQAAEFNDWSHLGHLGSSRHWYDEVGGRSLEESWSRRPERSWVTPCTRMFRDSSSSCTTPSGMHLHKFFTSSRIQRSSGRVKVWKLTPSFSSRDGIALTASRNPSAVDGTTISSLLLNLTSIYAQKLYQCYTLPLSYPISTQTQRLIWNMFPYDTFIVIKNVVMTYYLLYILIALRDASY